MNETLIRRLVGAGVLAAGALVVSLLLPQPNQPPEIEEGLQVVEVRVDESGQMVEQSSGQRPLVDGRDRSREEKGRPALSADAEEGRYSPDSVELAASGEADIRPPADSGSEPAVAERAPEVDEMPEEPAPEPKPAPAVQTPTRKPAEKPVQKPQAKPAEPLRKPEAPKPATTAPVKEAPKPAPAPATTPKPEVATASQQPAVTPPPKPEASAATPKPATPAASGAVRWAVQAGSYADIANARQIQAQLKSLGYPSNITVIDTSGGARYRVRCGPFATREAADAARGRIAGSKLPAQVVNDGP